MDIVALVVPCYNEAERLRPEVFLGALRAFPWLRMVLVDDGSRDTTRKKLEHLASCERDRVSVVALPANVGKAEAVRQGLHRAMQERPSYVGYWDADLATPFEALPDFMRVFELQPHADIVIGSRVRLLGRDIQRSAARHYTGRVFATMASLVLGIPVYDTQCGAKVLRSGPWLERVLSRPFGSRWIFDVELLARYLDDRHGPGEHAPSGDRIYELALRSWIDEPGSKVRAKDGLRAAADLFRIYRARSRRPEERASAALDSARLTVDAAVPNSARTDRSTRT